jgi:predicted nucleotidyltransferase
MIAPPLEALPSKSQAALQQFTDRLAAGLGENLVAAVLYGGAAKGQFTENRSDLNVVVVLREASLAALDEIASAAALAQREAPLQLMILAETDLAECVEVFATKFHDMQRHHILLRGRDVLAPLAISRERLIRQARRELVNLKLRLRQAYWQRGNRLETLDVMLHRGCKTVQVNVAALLEDAALPGADRLRAVLTALERIDENASVESRCAVFLREVENALQALGPA